MKPPPPSVCRIGIAGGSGSGKSTLVRALLDRWGPGRVASLCLDDFYRDLSHLTPRERNRWDFDRPSALELSRFYRSVNELAQGRETEVPVYDFKTHLRAGFKTVQPAPLICAEGLFVWTEPRAVDLWDIRLYVQTPEEVRLSRRLGRDTAERGRELEEERQRFLNIVAPAHHRYVEPQAQHAHLILNGEDNVNTWLTQIFTRFPELSSNPTP
jgi:uridine kinase